MGGHRRGKGWQIPFGWREGGEFGVCSHGQFQGYHCFAELPKRRQAFDKGVGQWGGTGTLRQVGHPVEEGPVTSEDGGEEQRPFVGEMSVEGSFGHAGKFGDGTSGCLVVPDLGHESDGGLDQQVLGAITLRGHGGVPFRSFDLGWAGWSVGDVAAGEDHSGGKER